MSAMARLHSMLDLHPRSTRPALSAPSDMIPECKRRRASEATSLRHPDEEEESALPEQGRFDGLPDDILLNILASLASAASSPAELLSVMLTCKRFHTVARQPLVMAKVGVDALSVKAASWSGAAYAFVKACADAGNVEACYMIGMIRFFCLNERSGGVSMMAKAALESHGNALLSLAVIQFNGSGASRKEKNLRAGATLCARAALLGHAGAIRELGHCLQDGYGVAKNAPQGRKLLVEAAALETREALRRIRASPPRGHHHQRGRVTPLHTQQQRLGLGPGCGGFIPCAFFPHPANRFLCEWFAIRGLPEELRLCSHAFCGRPETRKHEFRRCSACGTVNYCSRACQARDWKLRHRHECQPLLVEVPDDDDDDDGGNDDDDEEDDDGGNNDNAPAAAAAAAGANARVHDDVHDGNVAS